MSFATAIQALTLPRRTIATAVIAMVTATSFPSPIFAQGFFDFLFGGARRAAHSIDIPLREPLDSLGRALRSDGEASHRSRGDNAYCVRSCDGRYFPVQAAPGLSAERACKAMCPAGDTKIFYGSSSNIDNAVTAGGLRYADLPAAFAYRERLVEGCSCNGRSPLGIARLNVKDDPTLRPGDVVVTKNGLMAYTGKQAARFTPASDYRGFPPAFRNALARMDIADRAGTGAFAMPSRSTREPRDDAAPGDQSSTQLLLKLVSAAANARAQAPPDTFDDRWQQVSALSGRVAPAPHPPATATK